MNIPVGNLPLKSRAGDSTIPQLHRYYDLTHRCDAIKLLPAEFHVTQQELALVTVLGSCVAACLRDPFLKIGGMNHFMLPDGDPGDGDPARYGSFAMELLINALLKEGANRTRLEAKVFGGGNVLKSFTSNQVGTRNADFIIAFLAAENIPIRAEDLRGIHPRKVCFFPTSGRALIKHLPHSHETQVVVEENNYSKQLKTGAVAGSVELFI